MDPPPPGTDSAPEVGVAKGVPLDPRRCPAPPFAYSLVNVHCHGQVVPGKDRRIVVEAAVGTDVELWAPGSRKEM